MGSLGKLTKRAFFKGANDGAPARTKMADITDVKGAGNKKPTSAKEVLDDYEYTRSNSNDNTPDGKKVLAKVQEENAVVARLMELVDAGDTFALNKYAKKHFGMSWTKLKKDPRFKDMI